MTPDRADVAASGDSVEIYAGIPVPIAARSYVFFRIVSPHYGAYYITADRGLVGYPAPYLPGPVVINEPVYGYSIGRLWWRGLLPGTYYMEAGAVNADVPVLPSGFNYLCDVYSQPLSFR